jgi:hypothetical protein
MVPNTSAFPGNANSFDSKTRSLNSAPPIKTKEESMDGNSSQSRKDEHESTV